MTDMSKCLVSRRSRLREACRSLESASWRRCAIAGFEHPQLYTFALLTELTRSDGHPGRVTLPKSLLSGIAPRDGCDIQNRFVFK